MSSSPQRNFFNRRRVSRVLTHPDGTRIQITEMPSPDGAKTVVEETANPSGRRTVRRTYYPTPSAAASSGQPRHHRIGRRENPKTERTSMTGFASATHHLPLGHPDDLLTAIESDRVRQMFTPDERAGPTATEATKSRSELFESSDRTEQGVTHQSLVGTATAQKEKRKKVSDVGQIGCSQIRTSAVPEQFNSGSDGPGLVETYRKAQGGHTTDVDMSAQKLASTKPEIVATAGLSSPDLRAQGQLAHEKNPAHLRDARKSKEMGHSDPTQKKNTAELELLTETSFPLPDEDGAVTENWTGAPTLRGNKGKRAQGTTSTELERIPEVFPAAGPEELYCDASSLSVGQRGYLSLQSPHSSLESPSSAPEHISPGIRSSFESRHQVNDHFSTGEEIERPSDQSLTNSNVVASAEDQSPIPAYAVSDASGQRRTRRGRELTAVQFRERITDDTIVIEGVAVSGNDKRRNEERGFALFSCSVRSKVVLAIMSLLLIAGATLSAVFLSKTKDDDRQKGRNETSPPTQEQTRTPPPTSERYATIKTVLKQFSSHTALEDLSSPQHKALLWLADEDEHIVDVNDSFNLTQRFALATLFFSTRGMESWVERCNFLSAEHQCDWHAPVPEYGNGFPFKGAFCAENGVEIKDVLLPINNLTGALPNELGLLSGLLRVGLWNNALGGSIPLVLGNLTELNWLFLDENALTGTLPSSLGHLQELRTLGLSKNGFSGTIPAAISSLKKLQSLSLHENILTGIIPPSIGELSDLEWLYLDLNKLAGPIPSSLGQLYNLKDLWLGFNELTGSIPTSLNNLRNLDFLFLSNNRLSGTLPFTTNSLLALRTMRLRNNTIMGSIPEAIFTYRDLIRIDMGINYFTGTLPSSIGGLSNLVSLDMTGNRLYGTLPPALMTLDQLYFLTLSFNRFGGTMPSTISNLSKQETFVIQFNKFEGSLPDSIGKLQMLRDVVLNHNLFNGTIPRGVADLKMLNRLTLNNNSFTGQIDFLCNNSISILIADCHGDPPEVSCGCCPVCCNDEEEGGAIDAKLKGTGCFVVLD